MIVYRDQRSRADPRRLLSELRALTRRFTSTAPPHALARNALISAGKLEAAVADALFVEADGTHLLARSLRQASISAGHVLWHTWRSSPGAALWWRLLGARLNAISEQLLPNEVEIRVPEGYSQYGVYPEMYLEAARKFHAESGRVEAVCLGLRSIGTSLSAVVAAALEELGSSVQSATLRPRGDPFSRSPRLTGELRGELRPTPDRWYLLIDEGPGISGSSLAGTAAMLRDWGVPDDRIVLFPSWQTDGSTLRSEMARNTWSRHGQFTASFDEVWIASGKLAEEFPGNLRELSAGAWRARVYSGPTHYPAVQPQHERRKYLLTGGPANQGPRLLKFAGLGQRAEEKLRRAQELAEAGYTPQAERVAHGFLLQSFVPGSPVNPAEADGELVEIVASYLAHLSREYPAGPTVSCENLREMITVNLNEGLEVSWSEGSGLLANEDWEGRVVALDGRMLAHEWIATPEGYRKVDALDHHDDHFFPGCQDIAWDVAAAAIELNLSGPAAGTFIDRYRSLSDDRTISRRLPFYATAYLAFRLGYCTLATSVLGETPDGLRFSKEIRRYKKLLEEELSCGSAGRLHGEK